MDILKAIHCGHSVEEYNHHFGGIKTHKEICSAHTFPKSYIVAHGAIKQRLAITPIKYVLCYAYCRIAWLVANIVIACILFKSCLKVFKRAREEQETYVDTLHATMFGIFVWLFPNVIYATIKGFAVGLFWPVYVPCIILDAIKN